MNDTLEETLVVIGIIAIIVVLTISTDIISTTEEEPCTACIYDEAYIEGYQKGYIAGEKSQSWLKQDADNYQMMRDIFTPINSSDTVTITYLGYKGQMSLNGSRIYLGNHYRVNHTVVCNSFFFDDQMSYLVVIPTSGRIYVI